MYLYYKIFHGKKKEQPMKSEYITNMRNIHIKQVEKCKKKVVKLPFRVVYFLEIPCYTQFCNTKNGSEEEKNITKTIKNCCILQKAVIC